jgi:hypothetical protein
MNRIGKTTIAALAFLAAFGATPAVADTISNPANTYSFPNLSGSLTGGNQTQYIGETFTAPISGDLTNFQFTLNTSSLQSLYGVVFGWNGISPTPELWRSSSIAGAAGLKDFSPTGVSLTQGQTYVAFLSTYGLDNNAGLATVGTCLTFGGCASNSTPNLGTLVYGNVLGSGLVFNQAVNNAFDATFSATITAAAVPEPATWAMMILGLGGVGAVMRRRPKVATRVCYSS